MAKFIIPKKELMHSNLFVKGLRRYSEAMSIKASHASGARQ